MNASNLHNSEKWLERQVCDFVRGAGGFAIKITSSTTNGLPDRLVLLPGGVAEFVELKSIGRKQTPAQRVIFQILQNMGFRCTLIDSETKLKQWQNSTHGPTKPK